MIADTALALGVYFGVASLLALGAFCLWMDK